MSGDSPWPYFGHPLTGEYQFASLDQEYPSNINLTSLNACVVSGKSEKGELFWLSFTYPDPPDTLAVDVNGVLTVV